MNAVSQQNNERWKSDQQRRDNEPLILYSFTVMQYQQPEYTHGVHTPTKVVSSYHIFALPTTAFVVVV